MSPSCFSQDGEKMITRKLSRAILAYAIPGFLGSSAANGTALPKLTIYAYDSFASKWGPGSDIKKAFESDCECEVVYSTSKDSASLIARLGIEGSKSPADIVIGIDDALSHSPGLMDRFYPVDPEVRGLIKSDILPKDQRLLPFNYGYFAFMFDTKFKAKNGAILERPVSMRDLLTSGRFNQMVLMQDPRSSAPGLGLLLWIHALYGDKSGENLALLRKKSLSVAKSWSESYGFFTKGEAPLVLSYTTSEAYHREEEKTDRYAALRFEEGQYISIEHAALMKTSSQPALAKKFIKFLAVAKSQELIARRNWMFPSITGPLNLPLSFSQLPAPTRILRLDPAIIQKNKSSWIREWSETFAK